MIQNIQNINLIYECFFPQSDLFWNVQIVNSLKCSYIKIPTYNTWFLLIFGIGVLINLMLYKYYIQNEMSNIKKLLKL